MVTAVRVARRVGNASNENMDIEPELFGGIVAKDPRYNARAYCLVAEVLKYLVGELKREPNSAEVIDGFHDYVIDRYGPMSFMVLEEWGLKECQDVGEVVQNLVEAKFVPGENGIYDGTFPAPYVFKDAFYDPFVA